MLDSGWHLAQFNVARALAPLDSPLLAGFMAALDDINALAERTPGFVWRLTGDSGNATDIRTETDPLLIVNLSVWASVEALFDYVYRSDHTKIMNHRRQWFERPAEPHMVLWWIPAGQVPTLDESRARLARLRAAGATPEAFTFKKRYSPPGIDGAPPDRLPEASCVGWT